MSTILKKAFFASVLSLIIVITSAWSPNNLAFAEGQPAPETPLFPGLTWKQLGVTERSLTLNVKGDKLLLSGDTYQAAERFVGELPSEILAYYSNGTLAQSGWVSDDAYYGADGLHLVFYHETGRYLAVEYLDCQFEPGSTCLTVWLSAPVETGKVIPANSPDSAQTPSAAGAFTKNSPADGATGLSPTLTLTWNTYTPTPEKYSYCVKEGSACATGDPNWTGNYTNKSVVPPGLQAGKTYYWQVRALTCGTCTPKTWVYADNGTWWTFTTANSNVTISGYAGIAGATLSYTDGSAKTVTANESGNYTITVPYNWSGTVIPSKTGYLFTPASKSYTNLQANQTGQNYTSVAITYTISGNVGAGGTVLSYTDGSAKTVSADGSGNYALLVSYNWSGTVTPSKAGYLFSPTSKSYTNVTANQTGQNFIAKRRTVADFNGDGKTDVSIFRPSGGVWFVKDQFAASWGLSGDIPVPGDYNADGTTDIAIFRPSTGQWYVKDQFAIAWGISGDIPVPGDYNADGRTDIAIYRPSTGEWFVKDQFAATLGFGSDIPVPGDYNGDGRTDIAIYRPSTGQWFVKDQSAVNWGASGDTPVPGDYNGDGMTDIAIYRPSTGQWFVKDQSAASWGVSDDIPVPGDYNGDGRADIAIYRPSTGQWFVKDQLAVTWGVSGDYPVPAPDTNGDGDPYQ